MKQPVVIDRDTLKGLIEGCHDAANFYRDIDDHESSEKNREAALKAEKALSNPFIAVSERLPESEEMKIDLLLGDGSILSGARHDGGCAFWHRIGYFYSAPIISGDNHPLVTHWRTTAVV